MKIVRMNYSRSPWRLLNDEGQEVYWQRPFKHASLGATVISEPVCGSTRAECTEKALEMLSLAMKHLSTHSTAKAQGQGGPDTSAPDSIAVESTPLTDHGLRASDDSQVADISVDHDPMAEMELLQASLPSFDPSYGADPDPSCGLEGAYEKVDWAARTAWVLKECVRHGKSMPFELKSQIFTMCSSLIFVSKQLAQENEKVQANISARQHLGESSQQQALDMATSSPN